MSKQNPGSKSTLCLYLQVMMMVMMMMMMMESVSISSEIYRVIVRVGQAGWHEPPLAKIASLLGEFSLCIGAARLHYRPFLAFGSAGLDQQYVAILHHVVLALGHDLTG